MEIKNVSGLNFKRFPDLWISEIEFMGITTTIEVYEDELPETLISLILLSLNDKMIELSKNAVKLLTTLAEVFWGDPEEIRFEFSGFTIGLNQNNLYCDYRLCYSQYHKAANNLPNVPFSDSANWMVDIQNFRVVGCARELV